MKIFPAIDIYEGKAVRLLRGDYNQMTVYSDRPWEFAAEFMNNGASCLHLVDLEGAKLGTTPNMETIRNIVSLTGAFTELGGGIRDLKTIEKYLNIGVNRLILGTVAITEDGFVEKAIKEFGRDAIAVGIDILNEHVAIKGWTEITKTTCHEFFCRMQDIGVKTIICTDISKDGAMEGTNCLLYKELAGKYEVDIVASGGISNLNDVVALRKINLYGAILGKAVYTGAIELAEAIRLAENVDLEGE